MQTFQILRYQGLRNSETKEVEYGYLYVEFLADTCFKNRIFSAGKKVGFQVKAKNRPEAIREFKSYL
jgi:hypothetical protein